MDEKENYTQFKEIKKEDEELILARLLSDSFSLEESVPTAESIEFPEGQTSKQYPVSTLTVSNQQVVGEVGSLPIEYVQSYKIF
jgi:hypothetical protein